MNTSSRLVIRVGTDSLSFAVIDDNADNQIVFEPYDMRSGISVAANLREAFAKSELLMAGYDKVHVVVRAVAGDSRAGCNGIVCNKQRPETCCR